MANETMSENAVYNLWLRSGIVRDLTAEFELEDEQSNLLTGASFGATREGVLELSSKEFLEDFEPRFAKSIREMATASDDPDTRKKFSLILDEYEENGQF